MGKVVRQNFAFAYTMATPVGGVNPGGNPYAGGSLTRAGRPTGATGDFNSVGSPGFPTPSAGQIAVARNNQGTNVRIPYSRVVPMHGKDKLRVRDHRLAGTGVSEVYEYDGLEAGELAWVMGKQFAIEPRDGGVNFPSLVATAVEHAVLLSNIDSAALAINRIAASWRSTPPGGFLQAAGGGIAAPGANPPGAPVGPDGAALVPQDAFGGYGPDRMQRVAYTNWVEAFFEQRIATQRINLATLPIMDDAGTHAFLDADIRFFGGLAPKPTNDQPDPTRPGFHAQGAAPPVNPNNPTYLQGATVLCVPDLAYALQATPNMRRPDGISGQQPINPDLIMRGHVDPMRMQVQVPMMQGLFLMEQGPFLRSIGVDHHGVDVRLPERFREWVSSNGSVDSTPKLATVDRHLGSELAQKALYCALKKHGVFNWVPDGICLSKYSTGPDGYADDGFDARDGQLINIGVQGPCITKTWAMGDSAMHAMPGDKVFIAVVGTINYEVGDRYEGGAPGIGAQGQLNAVMAANAKMTRDLAREGFSEDRVYDGPNQSRPNAARYATRNYEAAAAESARRVLYGDHPPGGGPPVNNGTCDRARIALNTWLNAQALVQTRQSEEFKKLVDTMNNLRAVADPSTTGEATWDSYREAAVAQLKVVQNAFSDMARANVGLGSLATFSVPGANPAQAPSAQFVTPPIDPATGAPVPNPDQNLQDGARVAYDAANGRPDSFAAVAADVRAGRRGFLKAELTDIRLKRMTSSYMSNNSHFDPADKKSRCGLNIGYNPTNIVGDNGAVNPARTTIVARGGVDPGNGTRGINNPADGVGPNYYTDDASATAARNRAVNPHAQALKGMRSDNAGTAAAPRYATMMPMGDIPVAQTFTAQGSVPRPPRSGTSEFILGAWCIGTVTDSAASRAVMHANQVRTAPSSMAINVNVNIEWWDADMLYQKYMDKDRGHYKLEGEHPAIGIARKQGLDLAPVDNTGAGGFDLSPTVVQQPQHTTMARNEPTMRGVDDYVRELNGNIVQTQNPDGDPAAGIVAGTGLATALLGTQAFRDSTGGFTPAERVVVGNPDPDELLKGLAIRRLSEGRGDYEGTYVQPDPRGVDEDPEGLRIYDNRTIRQVPDLAANRYVHAAGNTVALVETRHWAAARNSFI